MRINFTSIAIFLSVIGPAIITSAVNNDAGGITVYSVAGAHFGYSLLWILIPTVIVLVIVQEMCARMGVVTKKGLSDLIREKFGIRVTMMIMAALLVANFGTTLAEFLGIAASSEILGVSKFIAVPLSALIIWIAIVKGTYKCIEKIFLAAIVFYAAYILSGLMANPNWGQVGTALVMPTFSFDPGYVVLLVAVIATTVAPWQQFYLQASVVEKRLSIKQYRFTKLDLIIGGLVVGTIAFFVILTNAATLYPAGIRIADAADAAIALKPLAGELAGQLFAFGLFISSFLAAAILPLATAYYVCEGLGLEKGIDKRFRQAPVFYWLLTVVIAMSALLVLLPIPFVPLMILSQVAGGFVLPFIIIAMLLIINDKDIMGSHVNKMWYNLIVWTVCGLLIVLIAALMAMTFLFGFSY